MVEPEGPSGPRGQGLPVSSWELAKMSFGVLRERPRLLVFPLVTALAAVGALLLLVGAAFELFSQPGAFANFSSLLGVVIALGVVAFVVLSVVAALMTGALMGATHAYLNGGTGSVGEGWRLARGRWRALVKWGLVSATVGLAIAAVSNLLFARAWLVGLIFNIAAEVGWAVTTYFIVPVVMFEPWPAIGTSLVRSTRLFVTTFGKTVISNLWATLLLLPGLVVAIVLGVVALLEFAHGALLAAIVLGVSAVVLGAFVVLVADAIDSILTTVLYRYATTGRVARAPPPSIVRVGGPFDRV